MLGEQIGIQERQLDRVGDLFDLDVQPADVLVRDVGHLFQQQIFHLGTRQLLEQQVAARVQPHGVATAQVHTAQVVGQLADPLFVGAPDDHGPNTVVHELFDGDDLAAGLAHAGGHHVKALVQHHLGTALQRVVVDVGMHADAHLATTGQDVDRAVFVLAHDHAIGRRRLAELVDLVAQGGDVLARLSQGVAELLVLRDSVSQLTLGLEQAFFQSSHPLGGIGQPAAELGDLLVEYRSLRTKDLDGVVIGLCHGWNLHAWFGEKDDPGAVSVQSVGPHLPGGRPMSNQ